MTAAEPQFDQVYVFPASEAQRSLWFLEQLTPGRSLYNLHLGKSISSRVDVNALEASVNEIVRRHESLRTAFREIGGETVQVIAPTLYVPLQITHLEHLPERRRRSLNHPPCCRSLSWTALPPINQRYNKGRWL